MDHYHGPKQILFCLIFYWYTILHLFIITQKCVISPRLSDTLYQWKTCEIIFYTSSWFLISMSSLLNLFNEKCIIISFVTQCNIRHWQAGIVAINTANLYLNLLHGMYFSDFTLSLNLIPNDTKMYLLDIWL